MHYLIKIGMKIVLSRLPLPYAWVKRFVFRHGFMDTTRYAVEVFEKHVPRDSFQAGSTVLEIGPGDSLASGLIAHVWGGRAILVDAVSHATRDIDYYNTLSASLGVHEHYNSFDELLTKANIIYLTEGLKSMQNIDNETVDYLFSHAVLEHVPIDEVRDLVIQTKRVLKRGARFSHKVDFQDHLTGGLNNLRFSQRIWESRLFKESGFYTNRMRCAQMRSIFEGVGFTDVTLCVDPLLKNIPISRRKLSPEFHHLSDEDLRISGCHIFGHKS